MTDIEARIVELLRTHRRSWTVQSGVAKCTEEYCDWSCFGTIARTTDAHAAHLAAVLVKELGLKPMYAYGAVIHTRYVTDWSRDE